jgi:hypothetical protein
MGTIKEVFRSPIVKIKLKVNIFQAACLSILLYGCESWMVTEAQERSLNSFATNCYRVMLNIRRQDRITNGDLQTNRERNRQGNRATHTTNPEKAIKVCWPLLEEDRERADQQIRSLHASVKSQHERPRESEDDLCRVHRPPNQQRRAALGWRDTENCKRLMEESRRGRL